MIIPKDLNERAHFYRETIDQCFASLPDRIPRYDSLRSYYLYGTDEGDVPIASLLYPHIDNLSAMLYSSETTRFTIELGAGAHKESEHHKIGPCKHKLQDCWHDSGADVIFGEALVWALVFDSMILYPVPKAGGNVEVYLLPPWQFGVYREDEWFIRRQEAMAFRYPITRSQLLSELRAAEHPAAESFVKKLPTVSGTPDNQLNLPAAVQRIITTSAAPNVIGQALWWSNPQTMFLPKVQADTLWMEELWVWDDVKGDFRRASMCENIVVYDRHNTFLPTRKDTSGEIIRRGEAPFVQLCPNPHLGYFWGRSELATMIGIQNAWSERIAQIRKLGDKVADPPKAGMGISVDEDEARMALNSAGGWLDAGVEAFQGKIQEFKPEIPSELWTEVEYYQTLRDEISGLNRVVKGQGESGVRSRGQTDTLARLGSTRPKKRAMIVEDALNDLAGMMFHVIQEYNKETMVMEVEGKKEEFVASQFTPDHTVKVDAHSMSPIFVEDAKNDAFALFEAKAIDRESLLELVHPHMLQQLKERLKTIEANERVAAQMEQAQEQQDKIKRVK